MEVRGLLAAVVVACCVALAAGCGGGSGEKARLELSPATLVASVYQGESASASVDVTLSTELSGTLYAVVVDAEGEPMAGVEVRSCLGQGCANAGQCAGYPRLRIGQSPRPHAPCCR